MKSGLRFLFSYHSVLLLTVGLGVASVAFFARPSQNTPPPAFVQPSLPPEPLSPETPGDVGFQETLVPPAPITTESVVLPVTAVAGITPVQIAHPNVPVTGGEAAVPTRPPASRIASQAGATIEFKPLKLVSNQWGAPPDEKLTCSVFLDEGKTFGWRWDRQDPKPKSAGSGLLPIYPSVRVGGNHREQSNIASFPVKLSDVKSLDFFVDYKFADLPVGTYNLSYDFFLLDSSQSGLQALRKAEIMIWLRATLGQPPETYRGNFTDGYNTYALYSFTMHDGRLYYAFVMKDQPQSEHRVNVKKLLEHTYLDPDWYIPGIELGNEVLNGSGKIEINDFSVNLNGTTIGG